MKQLIHATIVLLSSLLLSGGCPESSGRPGGNSNQPGGPTTGGTQTLGDYTLPVGQTIRVTSDLVINASGNVNIAGQLVADAPATPGSNGHSITIIAQGSITITGLVQAGHGAAGDASKPNGGAGGGLTLQAGTTLSLGEYAALASGSGAQGADAGLGGTGGHGGNLVLNAAGAAQLRGALTIGNGGNGGGPGANFVPDGDMYFTGHGGNAGSLLLTAASVDWPGYTAQTHSVDARVARVTGGRGGDAANIVIRFTNATGATTQIKHDRYAEITIPWVLTCGSGNCIFHGAKGGDGHSGGDGTYFKLDASSVTTYGANNQFVLWAIGGEGGDVVCEANSKVQLAEALAGDGGWAEVRGAPGMPGEPGQEVVAEGGRGGFAYCGLLGKGGAGGSAHAFGGAGGHGRDGECMFGYADQGENGGGGGNARAGGGDGGGGMLGGDGGLAEAYGGLGGNGGLNGGAPGLGGAAMAQAGSAGAYVDAYYQSGVRPLPRDGLAITVPGSPGNEPPDCP